MLRSRYYYYLIYLQFIVCLIEFAPQFIYAERYTGSLSSLFVALLLMSVLVIVFESRIKMFPGETFAQIMNGVFSKSVQKVLFFSQLLFSYWTGLIFLVLFAQIAHKFISPDLSTGLLFSVFLVLVLFAARFDSKSILFMTEIVVLLHIPMLIIVLLIFTLDPSPRFDFMVEAATYIRNLPSYRMIAAGTFLFNGFMNLLVFHEHLVLSNRKSRHVVVFAIGLLLLSAYYFIPIGYFGMAGIGNDDDVWFTTANSMKIQYFFIERFLFVFHVMQLGVSLMFVILCWHSSLQFLKLANLKDGGKGKWISSSLLLLASCFFWLFWDETAIRNSFMWFLNINPVFEIALIGVVVWCARKRKTA